MSESLDTSFMSDTVCNHCDLKELVTTSTPTKSPNHLMKSPNHFPNNNMNSIEGPPVRKKKRIMAKNGKCRLSFHTKTPRHKRLFAADLFTTSVDMPWRYNFIMVSACYTMSWLFFSVIYYLIATWRGDFHHLEDEDWKPCFRNFEGFSSAFLYSMETQSTIGYGFRSPNEKCQEAVIMVVVQVIWANFVEAFVISSFLAKISRPKLRAGTLIFSEKAIISEREGHLCFILRIADLRSSPIVEGHVRLLLVKHHVTEEGEVLPLKMFDLDIGHSMGLDRMFLVWPFSIVHNIDERSPLYTVSKQVMDAVHFEIIVIFEGIVEATGTTTQARTSYLSDEILWGHRFEEILRFDRDTVGIDMARFHKTYTVPTPTCSAKDMYEMRGYKRYNPQNGDDDDDEEIPDVPHLRRKSYAGEPISWHTSRVHMESRI